MGCLALLQGIFLNQGWNMLISYVFFIGRQPGSLPLVPPGKPHLHKGPESGSRSHSEEVAELLFTSVSRFLVYLTD